MGEVYLNAIGTAVPEYKISQEEQLDFIEKNYPVKEPDRLKKIKNIYRNSGIKFRYSVIPDFIEPQYKSLFFDSGNLYEPAISKRMKTYEASAIKLLGMAARDCFSKLKNFNKKIITHVITFSCTGLYAPGPDIQLVEDLDLVNHVERTCINFMGCYAAINALKSAYHIVRSVPDAVVLIAGVEICSIHHQQDDNNEQLVANAIFGDGASAAIISGEKTSSGFVVQKFHNSISFQGAESMTWKISDFGYNLRLSAYVPVLIKNGINQLLNDIVEKCNIGFKDIKHYAIHPGGVSILKAFGKATGVSAANLNDSYQVLSDYGNMSSVTILFVLKKIMEKRPKGGQPVLACAFGPGLTMESMILKTV
jgi:alpha-pyrone synthase